MAGGIIGAADLFEHHFLRWMAGAGPLYEGIIRRREDKAVHDVGEEGNVRERKILTKEHKAVADQRIVQVRFPFDLVLHILENN